MRVAAVLAVLAGSAGLASLTALTSTAQADPSFTTAYAGVGSDVTQDVYAAMTGLSPSPGNGATSGTFDETQSYTPLMSSNATGNVTIDSFDANPAGGTTTSPGCLTTKLGGPTFDRPNSSTAGITALEDEVTNTAWQNTTPSCTSSATVITGQIDFARSARGPSSKLPGSNLTFIPFARDALGIATYDHDTGNLATNPITTGELTALYSSSTGVGTINGQTVKACSPIAGTAPLTAMENAAGVTATQIATATTASGCNGIEQNSANAFYATVSGLGADDFIIPISAGSWISQINGRAVDRSSTAQTADGVTLASICNQTTAFSGSCTGTLLGEPFTGTGTSLLPNTTYYQDTLFGYNIYTVVPTDSITGTFADEPLISLFVGGTSSLCQSSYQTSVINKFGFDSLTGSEGTCGSTTQESNG